MAMFKDREEVGFGLIARGSEGALSQAKASNHPSETSHSNNG